MNGFIACDISKFFSNSMQLLEAENKLIYAIHLKAFLFKLDNVLFLKYINLYYVNAVCTT